MNNNRIEFSSIDASRLILHLLVLAVFIIVFLSLSPINALAIAQEEEAVDIESLKEQLESSRAILEKSNLEKAPLDNTKNNLDQEEAALMKKLQNVVANESQAQSDLQAEALTQPLNDSEVESAKRNELSDELQKDAMLASTELKSDKRAAISSAQLSENENVRNPVIDNSSVELKKHNSELQTRASKLQAKTSDLQRRNAELQARLDQKTRELDESRNRLVIAETQVERLSGILEKVNSQKLAGYLGSEDSGYGSSATDTAQTEHAAVINPVSHSQSKEESLVGIVTAQKAFLRSGPSKEDSPIMSVSRGTRLVVETRNDQWYRVITPTGGRAWIATEMLSFGPGAEKDSKSALRIGGYEKITR